MIRNPSVRSDETAVSPVLATILLVVITLAVAATVFAFLDPSGESAKSVPAISWKLDETLDRLTVVTAAKDADWNRIAAQSSSCVQNAPSTVVNLGSAANLYNVEAVDGASAANDLNQSGAGSACGPASRKTITDDLTPIRAGDFLDFCASPVSALDVQIELVDRTAPTLFLKTKFVDVQSC